jgi:long-chain acyl-CoA synthetase
MLVDEYLAASAARSPERTALVCGDRRWSYGEVDRASDRAAARFSEAGAEHGDRIAICLDNPCETVVALFGALKAGCAFVIVNAQARPDYISRVVADSGARILVDRSSCTGRPVLCSTGCPASAEPTRSDTDLAALVYTSGSTGEPKGVMLTHRNITSAAEAISSYLHNTADDVILNALPLAFTYGLGQITTAFRVGATVVLERFIYPRAIVDTIERERVTGLPVVPTMATLLRQHLDRNRGQSLRYITNAGAAMNRRTLTGLREAFPAAAVFSMYGQTECQRASYLPPEQLDVRPDSVGIPIPGSSAIVVDEQGRAVLAGVPGELVVRGPHVMAGYWNRAEATRLALAPLPGTREAALRTGDLFRTDREGFLYFIERMDDVIKSGGEKVAPRVVEQVIAELPDVAEVSAFGMPDDVLGEIVAAVVTPADGASLTREQVLRHCHRRLDAHHIPKVVQVRDRLPTTATGKVSRRVLRQAAVAEGWSA